MDRNLNFFRHWEANQNTELRQGVFQVEDDVCSLETQNKMKNWTRKENIFCCGPETIHRTKNETRVDLARPRLNSAI